MAKPNKMLSSIEEMKLSNSFWMAMAILQNFDSNIAIKYFEELMQQFWYEIKYNNLSLILQHKKSKKVILKISGELK